MRITTTLLASLKQTTSARANTLSEDLVENGVSTLKNSRLFTSISEITFGAPTIQRDFHTEEKLRSLTKHESSVFQWYFYNEGIKQLQEDRAYKIYMKKKWSALASPMKTLYHYEYFTKCLNIDYHLLTTYKFARLLGWEVPPTSPYILFRKQYKHYYSDVSNNNQTPKKLGRDERRQNMKMLMQKRRAEKSTRMACVLRKNKNSVTSSASSRSELYRKCRQCWEEIVTDEQKKKLENKLVEKYNQLGTLVDNEIFQMDRLSWRKLI